MKAIQWQRNQLPSELLTERRSVVPAVNHFHFRFAISQRVGPGVEVVDRLADVRLIVTMSSGLLGSSSELQAMTSMAQRMCQNGLMSFTSRPMRRILPW